MKTKKCEFCGVEFERPDGVRGKFWLKRKYCSIYCRNIALKERQTGFKKGHKIYPGSEKEWFKKGNIPWNKNSHIQTNNALTIFVSNGGSANRGKTLSMSTIEKIKLARSKQINIPSGKSHWNWKGGTSELRKRIQQTGMYRKWRKFVFERDDYTCQECKQRGGKLNADHVKSYSSIISENKITTIVEAKKCSILWDVLNGRTLCESCHQKTDNYGSKSIRK